MSGTSATPGTSRAGRVGTYNGPAPLQEEADISRQGQRAAAEDFNRSDEEGDNDSDSESDDSRSEAEDLPIVTSARNGSTKSVDKRRRRVTLLVRDSVGNDDGDVAYPRLRFQDGDEDYSSGRRVSAVRAEHAAGKTQLTFRNDEDGNPTSTILIYTNEDDDSFYDHDDNVIDIVANKEELVTSVAGHPEAWFAAISKYIDAVDTLMEDSGNAKSVQKLQKKEISALRKHTQRCEATHGILESKMADAELTIEKARDTVTRLRAERSDARRENKTKTAKIREQEQTIGLLQDALNESQKSQKLSKKQVRTDFDPSDDSSSDESVHARVETAVKRESPGLVRGSHPLGTPFTTTTSASVDPNAHNPRYPDISDYRGKSSEDLEQWTAAAETKFARSWANFPTEWSKIEYLRDHCKDTAYSVVKLRALRRSENPYETAEQLTKDLEMNFGMSNDDRKATALQKLTNGDLKQKQTEGASEWIARYNLNATEARLDDATRRFYALHNLNNDYKKPATQNARVGESWHEFTARLRQLEKDNAAAYGIGTGNSSSSGSKRRDGRDKNDKSTKGARENSHHRPKEQFKIIREKKLCARCLKPGHFPSSPNAPCQDKKMAAWDKSLELNSADMDGQSADGEALKE